MYAEVLVELRAKAVDKTFTYKVPNGMKVVKGIRVLVPFGSRKLEGFVLNVLNNGSFDFEVKEIISVIDDKPVINEEMMELGKYISKKTLSPLITAYQTMLPSALKAKNGFKVSKKYVSYLVIDKENTALKGKQLEIYNLVKEKNKVLKKEMVNISSYAVKSLLDKGYLKEVKDEVYRVDGLPA